MNAYDQKMQMKRENIADRGIWTAKKRYILNVWDSEGVRYAEPKLKIMGIEAVKSSTPAPCRQMIKDGLKLVMEQRMKSSSSLKTLVRTSRSCHQRKYIIPTICVFCRTSTEASIPSMQREHRCM